ncbi:hypothetical protein LQK80_11815 [Bacillus thuringiensis]|nr:hypothetical protein [Bacillus thuringiensis]
MKRLQPENKEKILKYDFFDNYSMSIFNFIIGKGGGSGPFPINCFVGIRNN